MKGAYLPLNKKAERKNPLAFTANSQISDNFTGPEHMFSYKSSFIY